METTENTKTGTSENDENQTTQPNEVNQPTQKEQDKDPTLRTNFLEYDKPNKGEHTLALVYPPGEKRGTVAARIYISYEGDTKQAVFTAKDLEGNPLYPPTPKLYELKKTIKQNSIPLLEKARLAKTTPAVGTPQRKEEPLAKKEFKKMGEKILDEGKGFADSALSIATGTDRHSQIKSIRKKKVVQKSRGMQR
jgi:hypothetical protein